MVIQSNETKTAVDIIKHKLAVHINLKQYKPNLIILIKIQCLKLMPQIKQYIIDSIVRND